MALTRIRQQQILHLEKDLQAIKAQIKTFKEPVDLIANLPIEGNNEGDLRVCLEDSNIYIWNANDSEWKLSSGNNSLSVKTSSTIIDVDNKTEIDTNISIEDGSELSNDIVNLYLNGLIVDKQSYEVKILNGKITITWLDSEPLLKNDVLLLQYFEIEMSGSGSSGSSNSYSKEEIDKKLSEITLTPGPQGEKGDAGEQGPAGQDGLTTSIVLNGTTYNHVDGTITLPNYPTIPESLPANGGNANTVNGKTVESNVPANAKFTDTVYTHPTTSGNKHIPSGGSNGQILKWNANGTAEWSNLPDSGPSNIIDGSVEGSIVSKVPMPETTPGTYSFAFGQYSAATQSGAIAIGDGVLSSGYGSFAEGSSTVSSGSASHAEGTQTTASGDSSHAEGVATQATQYCAHAEGFSTKAIGMRSHAEGQSTEASGANAHAEGYSTIASGEFSHAEGSETQALGKGAHVEGFSYNGYTTKAYHGSHAEGVGCEAGKTSTLSDPTVYAGAHAEGLYTKATGKASHSEGCKTVASGYYSHAQGYETTASADYSHAEGYQTVASELHSHASGYKCTTAGRYSYAEGFGTQTTTFAAHVQGRYNLPSSIGTSSSYNSMADAFTIGNGSSDTAKSNAFRVTFSGAAFGLSAFNSTGADYAEYFEWKDGNPNNEDRIGYFVTLDENKIRIANTKDDYVLGIISGNQSIIGNSCEDSWNDMYLRDEFDRLQYEEVEVEREEEVFNEETGEIEIKIKTETETHIKLNPNYDPSIEYIPRSKRKEWGIVGMLGQIKVRDDGTCQVNGYCSVGENGIATKSDKGYKVLKRINESIILVLFK